jgi:GntR family transcriptional regulator/MocR family aminotransferase
MSGTRISIERGTAKPLYRQLREALEHEIAVGAVDSFQPLPSSRELGVSRDTVNTAYLELESEGFVEAVERRGLFVNQEMLRELSRAESRPQQARPVDRAAHLPRSPDAHAPEIAKARDWHRYPYPFVAGQVGPSSFPRLAWARVLREALAPPHLNYSFRDGSTMTIPTWSRSCAATSCRPEASRWSPTRCWWPWVSQQGLDVLAQALVRPGDEVVVENPGYPDARHISSGQVRG